MCKIVELFLYKYLMILINYCIFNKNGWTKHLNTLQLTLALRKHAQTARQFVGVFARDELPLIIDEIPAIIIANTDPSTKTGCHWIFFSFDNNGNVEFFDLLGKTLSH